MVGVMIRTVDRLGCCNVAHAKRTLHIKYPSNISNAILYRLPKRETNNNMSIMFYSVPELVCEVVDFHFNESVFSFCWY